MNSNEFFLPDYIQRWFSQTGRIGYWTPEKSIQVQKKLGADLIFALDECTSPLHDKQYTETSMRRSHAWEERSLVAHQKSGTILQGVSFQAMYGIIQGGPWVMPLLPPDRPIHLLGIGTIDDILNSKELLAFRLATIHNLSVMNRLMAEIRQGISDKKLREVKTKWLG